MTRPKRKVLIIDGEVDISELVAERLGSCDFVCIRASTPEDGLTLAKIEKPNLILLDLNLPHMSGFGVMRELRHMAEAQNIPVVVFSSLSDEDIVQEAFDLGARGFLSKLCSSEELITMVQEYSA